MIAKAHNIMSKDVVTIFPESAVIEAVELIVQNQVSGLPVVDRERMLHGIITEMDLLCLLAEETPEGKFVYDYMTREVVSFREEDSILDISQYMLKHKVRRVPILTPQGHLSGVVSRRDIIAEIHRMRRA